MATIFRVRWSSRKASRFPRKGEEKLFEQRIQINLETIPTVSSAGEGRTCLSEFR